MFTADNEIYIISQLPPSVSANKPTRRLFLTLVLTQTYSSAQQNPFPLGCPVRTSRNPTHGKASINNTLNLFCLHITLTSCPLAKPGHQKDINIPVSNRCYFIFIHVILHKGVWVGKLVFLLSLQEKTERHVRIKTPKAALP